MVAAMAESYTIDEFTKRYRLRDRREVIRYIALGVVRPMRIRGNSRLTENDMIKIVKYNTEKRVENLCRNLKAAVRTAAAQ